MKSASDNHFFMVASLPMMSVNQYLYRELGYGPEADLKPIGLIAQTPNAIVTSPALMARALKELAEYAKVSEAGFANMTTAAWFGLVAQPNTAPELIARMNRELVAILQQPEFIARLREVSFEALPGTPEDMTAAARKERELWKRVVEISGAKAE